MIFHNIKTLIKKIITPSANANPGSEGGAGENLSIPAAGLLQEYMVKPQALVEITSKCNFFCTHCSSAFQQREKLEMSMERFTMVTRQIPSLTDKKIRLHIDGEPTTHARFLEIALYANSLGLEIALATNGSTLREEFLKIRMDPLITISPSAEEFAARHPKMNYDRYMDKVRNYIRSWATTDSAQNIEINVLQGAGCRPEKDGPDGIDLFIDSLIASCALDTHCRKIDQYRSDKFAVRKCYRNRYDRSIIFFTTPTSQGGLYPVGGSYRESPLATRGFCDSPWKRLAVLADGRVSCCCVDLSGGTAFTEPNELASDNLAEIWENHPNIVRIRNAFLRGEVILPVCQRCLGAAPGKTRSVGFRD